MNSGTQTHNISGHIPSRLVHSQFALQDKTNSSFQPEALLFSSRPVFSAQMWTPFAPFQTWKISCAVKCCIEMQYFGCDTDSWAMLCACVAGWNTSPALGAIHFLSTFTKTKQLRGKTRTWKITCRTYVCDRMVKQWWHYSFISITPPCPFLGCQPRSVFQHICCTQSNFRKCGEKQKMKQHQIFTLYVSITNQHLFVRASSEDWPCRKEG